MSLLALVALVSCNKPDELVTFPQIIKGVECQVTQELSGWSLSLPIDGSGDNKVLLKHTEALRTMARTGNTRPLNNELCNYMTQNGVNVLKTGHKSDINRIGFATQLRVEHYIIAMYHPNNYPDHFIIYDELTKEWWRYAEGNSPEIYLQGSGD